MADDIRSALVTGAASGIGRALVEQLVAEAISMVAANIDENGLRSLSKEFEVRCEVLDVADRGGNDALAERVGAPDLVCLNAGVASQQALPVWATPDEEGTGFCR